MAKLSGNEKIASVNENIIDLAEAGQTQKIENIQAALAFQTPENVVQEKTEENVKEFEDIDLESKNSESMSYRGISLKDFEFQRKLMEEQNKQKKDLLQKAINKHAEKTAAEARKLHEVKSELEKLDCELSNDVSILRKQIELASLQYFNIEKNYRNVEAQFLKAKQDLYLANEKKEMLTEHLCTIIAHNEDRKAKRLTELMEKIGLKNDGQNGN